MLHPVPVVLYLVLSDSHLLELRGRKLSWSSTVEHLSYNPAVSVPVLLHWSLSGPRRLSKRALKLVIRNGASLSERHPPALERREEEKLRSRLGPLPIR